MYIVIKGYLYYSVCIKYVHQDRYSVQVDTRLILIGVLLEVLIVL